MRVYDYFLLGIKNILKRKKNNITNILIISVSSLILLVIFTISNTISDFIQKNIEKNVEYRTLFVKYDVVNESLDNVIEKLSTINNVYKVLEQEKYQTFVDVDAFKTEKTDGELRLVASDAFLTPPIIEGRNIEENDTNVIVCPLNFIADGNVSTRTDLYRTDYINGRDFLNKEIEIKYKSYDYSSEVPKVLKEYSKKFKLIGLYDTYDNYSSDNTCYVTFSDLDLLNETMKGNLDEYSEGVFWHPIVIVDDSKNIDKVSEDILNLGYTPIKRLGIDTNLSTNIKNVSIIMAVITSIICFISISLYIIKSIKDRYEEIGLLKSIGYKNNNIFILLTTEAFLVGIISFLIIIIAYIILYFSAWYVINFSSVIWSRFSIEIPYLAILLVIIFTFIIPIICSFIFAKKIKNINPIDIINK